MFKNLVEVGAKELDLISPIVLGVTSDKISIQIVTMIVVISDS